MKSITSFSALNAKAGVEGATVFEVHDGEETNVSGSPLKREKTYRVEVDGETFSYSPPYRGVDDSKTIAALTQAASNAYDIAERANNQILVISEKVGRIAEENLRLTAEVQKAMSGLAQNSSSPLATAVTQFGTAYKEQIGLLLMGLGLLAVKTAGVNPALLLPGLSRPIEEEETPLG